MSLKTRTQFSSFPNFGARQQQVQPLLFNDDNDPQRIKTSADPMPNGEPFVIKAPDRSLLHGQYCCRVFLVVTPVGFIIGFIFSLINWISGNDLKQTPGLTIFFLILTLIFIIIGCFACGRCPCQKNAEKWLTYTMTISMEESIVYITKSSNKNRWKISQKIPFSSLRSIGTKLSIKSHGLYSRVEKAWLILVLSDGRKITINDKPFEINEAKHFVQEVNKYLQQIYQQRQIEIRQHNQQFIQQLVERAHGSIVAGNGVSISEEGHNLTNNSNKPAMDKIVNEETRSGTLRKCAHCGGTFAIGYKFCDHCGQTAICDDNEEIKCVKCNGFISKNSKFCPNCGTKTNI